MTAKERAFSITQNIGICLCGGVIEKYGCGYCVAITSALEAWGFDQREKGFWMCWEDQHTGHEIVYVGENSVGKARHCNTCRELKVYSHRLKSKKGEA